MSEDVSSRMKLNWNKYDEMNCDETATFRNFRNTSNMSNITFSTNINPRRNSCKNVIKCLEDVDKCLSSRYDNITEKNV